MVVSDSYLSKTNDILGLAFIFMGTLFFLAKRSLEGRTGGGNSVVATRTFMKDIKRHNIGSINEALMKIGTGKGREERLGHLKGYSIRVTKGGRIIYDRQNGDVVLKRYEPAHKY